jgi:acylphosphatase
VRVLVHGSVQGVGFRYATVSRAASLGLGGWVRNRPDGSVEAVFEGPAERVESMVAWCGRGPSGSRVDRVETTAQAPVGERDFRVAFAQHPAG